MNSEHLESTEKKSLSPSDEAIHSFVKNVSSKMSKLLPATITKWFNSPNTSNTNGSAQMVDTSDSSTEDNDTETQNASHYSPPPLKKMRLNQPDVFEHKTIDISTVESRGTIITKSYEPVPALYTPVKRKFNKDSDIVSSPMTTVGEHKIDKVEKSDFSHSSDNSMKKRKSLFGTPSEASTKACLKSSNNSLRDPKQPSFNAALLGSPFYSGKTMYGGATTFINYPNIKQRKSTVVNESNNNDNTVSHATHRVMELLEQFSSPLVDARRMPQIVKSPTNYKNRIDNVQNSLGLYKNTELQVPSFTQLLRLKQRSRLMESTKAARQIIASHSSADSSPYPYLMSLKTKTENELLERQSSQGLKAKTRLTRPNRARNEMDFSNSTVQLPNAVLQVDSLPIFTSYPVIPKESNTFISDQAKELSTPENNSSMYTFSKPATISDSPYTSSTNKEFIFGSPERNLIKSTEKETVKSHTVIGTPPALETKKWQCSDCWVFNDPKLDNCVCCGGKKVVKPDTVSKCKVCNFANSQINKDICVKCEPSCPVKKSSGAAQWQCGDCWVFNNDNTQNCICCGGKKPNNFKNPSEKDNKDLPKPACTWKCATCCVSNDNDQKNCVCCTAKKSPGPTRITSVENTNKIITNKSQNMWKCYICLINNREDLNTCQACGNKKNEGSDKTSEISFKNIIKTKEEKWKCPECLVRNQLSAVKCICCDSVKPGCETSQSNKFSFDLNTNSTFKFGIDPMLDIKKVVKSKEKKPETVTSQSLKEAETNNNTLTKPPTCSFDIKPNQVTKSEGQTDDHKNCKEDLPKPTFTFGVPKQLEKGQTSTIAVPSDHHSIQSQCNKIGMAKNQDSILDNKENLEEGAKFDGNSKPLRDNTCLTILNKENGKETKPTISVFGQSETDAKIRIEKKPETATSQSLQEAETNNNILAKPPPTCSFDVKPNQVTKSEGQADDQKNSKDLAKPAFTFGVPKAEKVQTSTNAVPSYTTATLFHSNTNIFGMKKQGSILNNNENLQEGAKFGVRSEPLKETKLTKRVFVQCKTDGNESNNLTNPSEIPQSVTNTFKDDLNTEQNDFSVKSGLPITVERTTDQPKLLNTSIFKFDAIPKDSNHSTSSSLNFTSGSLFGNRDPIAKTTSTETLQKSEPTDIRSNLFEKQLVSSTPTTAALPITTPIFSFGATKVSTLSQEKASTSYNFGNVDPRSLFKSALAQDNTSHSKSKQILSEVPTFTPANTTLPNILGSNQIVPNPSLGSNNPTAGSLAVPTTHGGNGLSNSNPLPSLIPTNGLPNSNTVQANAPQIPAAIGIFGSQTDSGGAWPASNSMQKQVFSFGSTPFNNNTAFGNSTPTSTNMFGITTQQQNSQPMLFSTPVSTQNQETANLFGAPQAPNNTNQGGLFGNSNISAAPSFGTPNPAIPTFEVPSLSPAPAFSFSSSPSAGVFGFGQQTQGSGVYNFNVAAGSAPQVQFSMGSGPSDVVKRIKKKAVRRIPR